MGVRAHTHTDQHKHSRRARGATNKSPSTHNRSNSVQTDCTASPIFTRNSHLERRNR